jgi:hypothetical protein
LSARPIFSITLTSGAIQDPMLPEVESTLDMICEAARSKGKIATSTARAPNARSTSPLAATALSESAVMAAS